MEDLSINSQGYEEIEEQSTPHRPRNPFGTTRKDKNLGLENCPRGKSLRAHPTQSSDLFLANQTYDLFFRTLKIMETYRLEYALSLLKNKVPVTAQAIIIKDFNPYFAMGFLRPNMAVTYYITKRYKFNKPFSEYFNKVGFEHYLNLIPAFTLRAGLIKKLVRKNRTVNPKDLYITQQEKDKINFKVVKQEDISLREMLKTYGRAPILMLDASMIGYDFGIHKKKNDLANIWTFGSFDFKIFDSNKSIVLEKRKENTEKDTNAYKEDKKKSISQTIRKPLKKKKKPDKEDISKYQVINIEEAFSDSSMST